ncbi:MULTISPECIES: selenocysteine-specific translation elongation factor [Aerococcus]|uniref:Selenocysteine-specific elongation factor n=1 Tax=Aerococcus sanguinicola TaxID=119206 RepID=A0A5N1GP19_9LACT|nr:MULTISPECIES: selenocysteine-specific translation elongation factor [Aerococcus]KAA9302009.1 selenocysteine-specific translation elongation factor [Aerococcus sanguinicola]MDK6368566.1 selenocysteine-specific translation elongation factor [Aerococcus sp. UMB9870]MDK6679649.1 selenocysteine-specific translation elongation factor [Aerococcus sp. UMB8608]MDK6686493.1 selenocysteine-specific translation elongation factor [Aerococcus sp. UMB8623]MDK6940885.1 selenocysteine-specific translation e
MEKFVMGTAGHIDHGKTTLIKALTGIETDTTDEEKKRGLSINLGFAYMDLANGERLGIVDVPGHERFIKNMVAGVSGIDFALLVIDVNEGIMQQTREHIDILTLLGLKDFIIVLSKVDGVDPDLLEIVKEDIHEQFQGTVLEEAPIVETDAVTGYGIEELKALITEKCEHLENNDLDLPARMNVDRAFSVKGFGTVVTGTLIEGRIQVGDELTVYPSGLKTKVRTIQIHEEDQEFAQAGNRTALNLTKLSLDDISRGDVLSAGPLELSWMLDVKLKCLEDAEQSIELWDRVHLNIGTREVLARIVPLGVGAILPGEEAFVQLRLEEQLTVKKDDRFIIRSYSPVYTIGGGIVLDPNPKKHKRFNEEVIESLKIKEEGDTADILMDFMKHRAHGLTTVKEMSDYLNLPLASCQEIVGGLLDDGQLLAFGHFYMAVDRYEELANEMCDKLKQYHEKESLRRGMPVEEFRSQFNKLSAKELDTITKQLEKDGRIKVEDDIIRLADFEIQLTAEEEKIKEEILKVLQESAMAPPEVEELTHQDPTYQNVLNMLVGDQVFQLDRYTYLDRTIYDKAVDQIIAFIRKNGSISLAECRDLFQTSRKYALKLLEHLDKAGVTKRQDDVRVLKK